jgi:hypothetical protein
MCPVWVHFHGAASTCRICMDQGSGLRCVDGQLDKCRYDKVEPTHWHSHGLQLQTHRQLSAPKPVGY